MRDLRRLLGPAAVRGAGGAGGGRRAVRRVAVGAQPRLLRELRAGAGAGAGGRASTSRWPTRTTSGTRTSWRRWSPRSGTRSSSTRDARLVDAGGRGGRATRTGRDRDNNHADLRSLLVANAVSGAASLFRRDLLDLALPFPPAQFAHFHDHWLALCALARGRDRLRRPAAVRLRPARQRGARPRRRQPGRRACASGSARCAPTRATASASTAASTSSTSRGSPRSRGSCCCARARAWRAAKRRVLERFLAADRSLLAAAAAVAGGRARVRRAAGDAGRRARPRLRVRVAARAAPRARATSRSRGLRLDAVPPPDLAPRPGAVRPAGPAREMAEKIAPLTLRGARRRARAGQPADPDDRPRAPVRRLHRQVQPRAAAGRARRTGSGSSRSTRSAPLPARLARAGQRLRGAGRGVRPRRGGVRARGAGSRSRATTAGSRRRGGRRTSPAPPTERPASSTSCRSTSRSRSRRGRGARWPSSPTASRTARCTRRSCCASGSRCAGIGAALDTAGVPERDHAGDAADARPRVRGACCSTRGPSRTRRATCSSSGMLALQAGGRRRDAGRLGAARDRDDRARPAAAARPRRRARAARARRAGRLRAAARRARRRARADAHAAPEPRPDRDGVGRDARRHHPLREQDAGGDGRDLAEHPRRRADGRRRGGRARGRGRAGGGRRRAGARARRWTGRATGSRRSRTRCWSASRAGCQTAQTGASERTWYGCSSPSRGGRTMRPAFPRRDGQRAPGTRPRSGAGGARRPVARAVVDEQHAAGVGAPGDRPAGGGQALALGDLRIDGREQDPVGVHAQIGG